MVQNSHGYYNIVRAVYASKLHNYREVLANLKRVLVY